MVGGGYICTPHLVVKSLASSVFHSYLASTSSGSSSRRRHRHQRQPAGGGGGAARSSNQPEQKSDADREQKHQVPVSRRTIYFSIRVAYAKIHKRFPSTGDWFCGMKASCSLRQPAFEERDWGNLHFLTSIHTSRKVHSMQNTKVHLVCSDCTCHRCERHSYNCRLVQCILSDLCRSVGD